MHADKRVQSEILVRALDGYVAGWLNKRGFQQIAQCVD